MRYKIWSARNQQWYGANRAGYTPYIESAGVYDLADAQEIVFDGLPGSTVAIEEGLWLHLVDAAAVQVEASLAAWRTL